MLNIEEDTNESSAKVKIKRRPPHLHGRAIKPPQKKKKKIPVKNNSFAITPAVKANNVEANKKFLLDNLKTPATSGTIW